MHACGPYGNDCGSSLSLPSKKVPASQPVHADPRAPRLARPENRAYPAKFPQAELKTLPKTFHYTAALEAMANSA
jgi:hypothetical protein